jgi:ABC-type dipeptide/oligopeptide/nickel transport system permease subunit
MIAAGQDTLDDAGWISMMPAAVLFLTVLSITLVGAQLSQRFSIRESVG